MAVEADLAVDDENIDEGLEVRIQRLQFEVVH